MALHIDLDTELARLHDDPNWTKGHVARTLVKQDALRVVLIAIKADARIDEHKTEGPISIQPLRGRMRVAAAGESFTLGAGQLLTLEASVPHDVLALEDSAFLLTIGWRRA